MFDPKFPTHVDSTMMNSYRGCSYKFFLEHARGVQSPRKSIHLHFGGLIASACEIARREFYVNGHDRDTAIEIGSKYILQNYGDWDTEEQDVKTLRNAVWSFENYLRDAFPLGFDRFVPYRIEEGGKPMIEFSFALPTEVSHPETGDPILYTGRCDMIAADNTAFPKIWKAQQVWCVDEKTTKQMGASWANQWRLRSQFLGYTWAAQQSGLPAVGALVRGLCVYKAKEPQYHQTFVQFSDSLIHRWYTRLNDDLHRMTSDWDRGYWPQDFGETCTQYGGCQFIGMCELDDPEPFIQNKFVERRWNPLTREEEEAA